MVCEFMVNPRGINLGVPRLVLGARIGVAPASPGPNNRT